MPKPKPNLPRSSSPLRIRRSGPEELIKRGREFRANKRSGEEKDEEERRHKSLGGGVPLSSGIVTRHCTRRKSDARGNTPPPFNYDECWKTVLNVIWNYLKLCLKAMPITAKMRYTGIFVKPRGGSRALAEMGLRCECTQQKALSDASERCVSLGSSPSCNNIILPHFFPAN